MSAFRTAGERTTRPKRPKKKRSPGPKGRVTKRTGDVRSKPDEGKEVKPFTGKIARMGVIGPQ